VALAIVRQLMRQNQGQLVIALDEAQHAPIDDDVLAIRVCIGLVEIGDRDRVATGHYRVEDDLTLPCCARDGEFQIARLRIVQAAKQLSLTSDILRDLPVGDGDDALARLDAGLVRHPILRRPDHLRRAGQSHCPRRRRAHQPGHVIQRGQLDADRGLGRRAKLGIGGHQALRHLKDPLLIIHPQLERQIGLLLRFNIQLGRADRRQLRCLGSAARQQRAQ
jgi:hypothetical protein